MSTQGSMELPRVNYWSRFWATSLAACAQQRRSFRHRRHVDRGLPALCASALVSDRDSIERGELSTSRVAPHLDTQGQREQRPLGIPTVLDRMIQQAIAQVIAPVFEAQFSEHSHGFRPQCRAHDAVKSIQSAAADGRTYAVDCDLKSFFDTVNHRRTDAATRTPNQRRSGAAPDQLSEGRHPPPARRRTEATAEGVPQGGPLSPLLANIMLDDPTMS